MVPFAVISGWKLCLEAVDLQSTASRTRTADVSLLLYTEILT